MNLIRYVFPFTTLLTAISCKPKPNIQAEVYPQVQVISPKQSSVYHSGEKIPLVIRAIDVNTIDSMTVIVFEKDSSSKSVYAKTIPVFQTTGNFIDTFTCIPTHDMLVSLEVQVVHSGNNKVPFFSNFFEIRK